MPKISIIVPVYNVELYLENCIASILKQTFVDFELILIDDGSSDASGKICDLFQQKDSRIRVIHKRNGGLSSARNCGLDAASGEYIGFVDSDDYISEDMYEFLYHCITKENADISACGYHIVYKNKIISPNRHFYKTLDTQEASIKAALEQTYLEMPVWNRLYTKKLFENLRFPEGHNYEDSYIFTDLICQCKKIVTASDAKYYYVNRSNSITKSHSLNDIRDLLLSYERTSSFVLENCSSLQDLMLARISTIYRQAYNLLLDVPMNEKQELQTNILNFIYRHKHKILNCRSYNYKQKMAFVLFFCSRRVYDIIFIFKRMQRQRQQFL